MFTASAVATDTIGEPGRSAGKTNPLNNVYFGEFGLNPSNNVLEPELQKILSIRKITGIAITHITE